MLSGVTTLRASTVAYTGLGLVISVVIPVAMEMWPDIRRLLQRGMFVFSFFFVAREFSN